MAKPYRPPRATRGSRRPRCHRCHQHQPIWQLDNGELICGFCLAEEQPSTLIRLPANAAQADVLRGERSPHDGEIVDHGPCPNCGWAGGGRCLRCATYGAHGSSCRHVQPDGSVRP